MAKKKALDEPKEVDEVEKVDKPEVDEVEVKDIEDLKKRVQSILDKRPWGTTVRAKKILKTDSLIKRYKLRRRCCNFDDFGPGGRLK